MTIADLRFFPVFRKLVLPLSLFLVVGCARGSNDQGEAQRPIPPPPPSRGTAILVVTVGECVEDTDVPTCRVTVDRIIGYGGGVPQVPSGQELEVRGLAELLTDQDYSSSLVSVTLALRRSPGTSGSTEYWQALAATIEN